MLTAFSPLSVKVTNLIKTKMPALEFAWEKRMHSGLKAMYSQYPWGYDKKFSEENISQAWFMSKHHSLPKWIAVPGTNYCMSET